MGRVTTCIICGVSYFHSDYDDENIIYCEKVIIELENKLLTN
jgi:hypothetical protein